MAKNKWGVVPYRKKKGKVEVLVITTRNNNWGLPKGNFIKKLGARRTALREAFEEAGILGRIEGKGKSFAMGKSATLHFFPMVVCRQLNRWPEKGRRTRRWVSISKARRLLKRKAHRKAVAKLAA